MVVELGDCNIKWCHSRGAPDDLPHWRRVPGPVQFITNHTRRWIEK